MKIVVLGAGMVGSVMAADLKLSGFEVVLTDINQETLKQVGARFELKVNTLDVTNREELSTFIQPFDIVVSAVPGFLGYQTTQTVLEAGRNIVDIAFFPEDPFPLHEIATSNSCFAITDAGVTPGMSNVLLGSISEELDSLESIEVYVGGLVKERVQPYEYRAVFSPIDVIEEYIRPARYKVNGQLVTKPALSEAELLHFEGVGTLEAFITDGMRSILKTIDAPNMKEKTLRYPGHCQKMRDLRSAGFFDSEPINFNGNKISPLDFTSKLLFNSWELKESDRDFTVLRVLATGEINNKQTFRGFELYDEYDEQRQTTSMARTTGYTATSFVRAYSQNLIQDQGLLLPEILGKNENFTQFVLEDLKERGVCYQALAEQKCKSLMS